MLQEDLPKQSSGSKKFKSALNPSVRRGGRVVECTALLRRQAGNRLEGSNPSLSASFLLTALLLVTSEIEEPHKRLTGSKNGSFFSGFNSPRASSPPDPSRK